MISLLKVLSFLFGVIGFSLLDEDKDELPRSIFIYIILPIICVFMYFFGWFNGIVYGICVWGAIVSCMIFKCFIDEKKEKSHRRKVAGLLWDAIDNNDRESIEEYFSMGGDINTNGKNIPLLMASDNGCKEIVEFLIEKGAYINIQNNNKQTALMRASDNGYEEIVKLLIEKGADVNILDTEQKTALEIAIKNDHRKVIDVFINKLGINFKHGGETALQYASEIGRKDLVEYFLNKKADIDAKTDYNGWTSLMIASGKGHADIVNFLLSKKANIEIKSNEGWTSFMIAAYNGHKKIVEILLKNGANIEAVNDNGNTTLIELVKHSKEEMARFIVTKGANNNVKDALGLTIAEIIKDRNDKKTRELLEDHIII